MLDFTCSFRNGTFENQMFWPWTLAMKYNITLLRMGMMGCCKCFRVSHISTFKKLCPKTSIQHGIIQQTHIRFVMMHINTHWYTYTFRLWKEKIYIYLNPFMLIVTTVKRISSSMWRLQVKFYYCGMKVKQHIHNSQIMTSKSHHIKVLRNRDTQIHGIDLPRSAANNNYAKKFHCW